ncbi:hypothetical protein KQY27_01520 [Methanobrevibacter sp. TMH8]|uniref:hypothetical protein n=1 Tax=Methanobrevibacter sp. TMH8 TaxID=2848611 RepID=UPI001CCF9A44|nr:hypothetical protein [Methanobrevibacter sp. TMH8]MBZ9570225.1 hypothetical protein [Methanobrevibacter sp. TMH8]
MSLNNSVINEREKIKNSANEILLDYSDLDGLDDVFNSIWEVTGSKNFKDFIKNIKRIIKYFLEYGSYVLDVSSDFANEFPQIKYIIDAFPQGRFHYLLPLGFKDKMGLEGYDSLKDVIFGVLAYNGEVNLSDVFCILNKVMVLLDDFDKDIIFNGPDKEYFIRLKGLEFDKNAKKLLNKIDKIYNKYMTTNSDEVFDENPNAGYPSAIGIFIGVSDKALVFLCCCSAVVNNRAVVILDDVICAFKTYFKLLNLINKD